MNRDSNLDAGNPKESKYGLDTYETRLSRLAKLKSRVKEVTKLNREEISNAYRVKKQSRNANQKSLGTVQTLEASEKNDETGYKPKGLWEWTSEECEDWNLKRKKINPTSSSNQDFDSLAEMTYNKNVKELVPDIESYTQYKADESTSLAEYYKHKPLKKDVDRLATFTNNSSKQKLEKARKSADSDVADYISKSNMHFNKKLDRHYSAAE